MEPGETPEVTVVVEKLGSQGWSDAINDLQLDIQPGYHAGTTYAVVATREHLYVMPTEGWTGVMGVTMKLPIAAVDVHLERAFLGFRPDLNISGTQLTTMAGGKKSAKALVAFVGAAGG